MPESCPKASPPWLNSGVARGNQTFWPSKGTANRRVRALAALARELHNEMRDIARVDAGGETMVALQQMYSNVVNEGILMQARTKLLEGLVPEKVALLEEVANQLEEVGKQADQLASEVPNTSVRPLRDVAEVARQGTRQIRNVYLKEPL